MTATASRCPPADVIAAFAFGELLAANASSVQAHVSECESCLETVGHLAASSRPETLSVAALDADTLDAGLSRRGQIIGGYCLVRELGQGGMGEVWEAEQRTPVRRSVALKLLKAGMDTRQIVARFEAERQVLALMQHPGIAQVFDAGVTTNGRPYFVMEYVRGQRITRYCDEAELDLPARLLLFQKVCEAVQHAHQKGVIHRDIKPSNVLVTQQDGRPLPKVIDFGLAKLTAPDLKDATLTEIGTVLGTPAYASPEQMSLGAIDVDTRSDVYSLGVLLYELLVGVIPFEPKGGQPDALLELRRNIRELDPTRPSARLSMLGSHASEVARLRGTEVGMLRRQLRGDLDWIVMTALEKDRARRYASPGDLARDTQRYLDHEPVLAGSPTPAYRLRKFVRRHRMGTAFASILLSLVIAFAAVSALQVKRISAERVEKVVAVLREKLAEPPTLEELGRVVGCSPFHLSRTFSAANGMTIPQYTRQLRMERAAELLKSGKFNVTEAALEVGYSSLSHFSQAFHDTFGCCPGLYPLRTPTQKIALK